MIVDHGVVSAPDEPEPSYEELAALVVGFMARVETLEVENAELRRRVGMDSTNSSQPSSKDSIAAKAKWRADRSPVGAVQGPQARRAARSQGVGAGADCHAGSDRDPARAG